LLTASALLVAPASAAPQPPPSLDEWDRYAYCASAPRPLYGDDCCDWPGLEVPCEEPRPLEPAILYQEEKSESAGL
jgi:hypothetical protein